MLTTNKVYFYVHDTQSIFFVCMIYNVHLTEKKPLQLTVCKMIDDMKFKKILKLS